MLLLFLTQITHVQALKHLNNCPADSKLVLPPAVAMRALSLGYNELLADLYWLAFVQYVGDVSRRQLDQSSESEAFLNLITGLDPTFVKAYYFASFIVGGDLRLPHRASIIIDRGIEANESNWYLPFIGGINQYLNAGDEVKAASFYRLAASYPNAPDWLNRQASILEAKIPSSIKQINTWNNTYESARDGAVKARARAELVAMWSDVLRKTASPQLRLRAANQLARLSAPSK